MSTVFLPNRKYENLDSEQWKALNAATVTHLEAARPALEAMGKAIQEETGMRITIGQLTKSIARVYENGAAKGIEDMTKAQLIALIQAQNIPAPTVENSADVARRNAKARHEAATVSK